MGGSGSWWMVVVGGTVYNCPNITALFISIYFHYLVLKRKKRRNKTNQPYN